MADRETLHVDVRLPSVLAVFDTVWPEHQMEVERDVTDVFGLSIVNESAVISKAPNGPMARRMMTTTAPDCQLTVAQTPKDFAATAKPILDSVDLLENAFTRAWVEGEADQGR